MDNYGEYFRALRESKQLTLREVERATDVSNAYLSQLESGKIKQPSPLTLHKLAQFYGVSYELLMAKVGYPMPQKEEREAKRQVNSAAYRIGDITEEEEVEILNYLKFIRTRKK